MDYAVDYVWCKADHMCAGLHFTLSECAVIMAQPKAWTLDLQESNTSVFVTSTPLDAELGHRAHQPW